MNGLNPLSEISGHIERLGNQAQHKTRARMSMTRFGCDGEAGGFLTAWHNVAAAQARPSVSCFEEISHDMLGRYDQEDMEAAHHVHQ